MNKLRKEKISKIDGSKLILTQDFEKLEQVNEINGNKTVLNFPKSNVLIFETEDGTRVAARPSGTEPKIKFYFSVNMVLPSKELFKKNNNILDKKLERICKEFNF